MVEHCGRPLVIGIDDVDAADEASLRCLASFTRRIRSARVLVVLTESVQPHSSRIRLRAELPREPQSYFMRLDLLSTSGAETMLSRSVDQRTAQRLAPEYHALSGGNPLLLRGLIDDLCGADEARSPRAATASAFAEALLSCLYRCEPAMLQTARGLAVLGESATPSLLAALAGIDTDSTLRAMGALKATGVLAADWFRHPAAARAVLHGMAPRERTRLHAAAAHLLYKEGAPATGIAHQLLDAGDADVARRRGPAARGDRAGAVRRRHRGGPVLPPGGAPAGRHRAAAGRDHVAADPRRGQDRSRAGPAQAAGTHRGGPRGPPARAGPAALGRRAAVVRQAQGDT